MDRTPHDPATGPGSRPVLSLVVVVHDMPAQAERTLFTASPAHQRRVSAADYEVVVVENPSARMLGADRVRAAGETFRYVLNEEGGASPVLAVNLGVARARGVMVGILVDGARLLSPGIVELALMAARTGTDSVLAVPGYHLGSELQQRAADSGYDETREAALLSGIDWRADGYRLFDVACFSGSSAAGFFAPMAESNCICLPKRLFEALGGFDVRFTLPGGGYCNLDFYARAIEAPDTTFFVTPGEGTFHQFHGGVTTGGVRGEARERLMHDLKREYRAIRGRDFAPVRREPLYLGRIPPTAAPFVRRSMGAWGPVAPGSAS